MCAYNTIKVIIGGSMKKGFTLIELLAVILILGIIALIAIPAVSNVIEDSKKGAVVVSAENYIKALDDKLSLKTLKGENIVSGAVTLSEINELYPDLVNGEAPKTGTVTITNGKVTSAIFSEDKYTTICTNGKCETTSEYVYFQTSGQFTYLLEQTTDTLSSEYTVYLKIPKINGVLKTPQVCTLKNNREICLKNNDYEVSKETILNLLDFDNSWTSTQTDQYMTNYNKGDSLNTICKIYNNGPSSNVNCWNSEIGVYANKTGNVEIANIGKLGCKVNGNNTASCY